MGIFRLSTQDQANLLAFLRSLVQMPSPPTQERAVAERIAAEMARLAFRDVRVDSIGNVIGWIGPRREPVLMLSGHMDTVGVGDPQAWSHTPFAAEVVNGTLYGVGSCDMKGGLAAMLYGAGLLRHVSLKGSVVVACVVQGELCEGTGSRVLIEEEGIRPDWVVLGEPTNLAIGRGQRGRLEMHVTTYGRPAHSAFPNLGENAIYTAARLVFGLELLAGQLGNDDFLGPGTLAVTGISSSASGRNVVPERCEVLVDRRLTLGENETKALAEVQRIITREGIPAEVKVSECHITSYTGYTSHSRISYPVWVTAEDHPLVVAAANAVRAQLKRRPVVGYSPLSTGGVYTAGVAGISTIVFGPGDPHCAHAADEHVRLRDIYAAAEVYARLAVELMGTE